MRNVTSGISALALAVGLAFPAALTVPISAHAAGALDFLDSCIKTTRDFAEQRDEYFARLDVTEKTVDTLEATPEFKKAWLEAVRKQARPVFNEKIAPALVKMGATDMDNAFDVWFDMEVAALQPGELEKQITKDFRRIGKEELRRTRQQATADTKEAQDALDGACKPDVGSQALRLVLAPVGWVLGNFEAAKNEKNVVTQVFHALTGVSPQAIAENGILGGDSSFARQTLEPVIGGRNGAIQKGVGDIARTVKFWK